MRSVGVNVWKKVGWYLLFYVAAPIIILVAVGLLLYVGFSK